MSNPTHSINNFPFIIIVAQLNLKYNDIQGNVGEISKDFICYLAASTKRRIINSQRKLQIDDLLYNLNDKKR